MGKPHKIDKCSARCVIEGEVLMNCDGSVEGAIISSHQGDGGFGYDPLFIPEGYNQTFAQLGETLKNSMSHRSRAMEKVTTWLHDNNMV